MYGHCHPMASGLMQHLAQVVTQIGPVLDLEFPDGIQRIINALKPLAIDLQSILQLDCLAGSNFTFYAFWVVRCFLLPGLMLVAVGLQYLYERRRVDRATALGYFKANAFVVVFLCYVSPLIALHMQEGSDRSVLFFTQARGLQPSLLNVQLPESRRRAIGAAQGLLHQVLDRPARSLRVDRRRLRGLRVAWNPTLHGAELCAKCLQALALVCLTVQHSMTGTLDGAPDEGLRWGQRIRALRGAAGGRRAEACGQGGS
jgi:hypothetical protein